MYRIIAVLLFLKLWSVPAPLDAQESDSLLVALLRADGIALPFAQYSAGNWTRLPFDSVPAALRDSFGPWHLVTAEGETQMLRAGSLLYFDPASSETWYEAWGQLTEFAPRSFPEGYPAKRVGALLSREVPATALRRLDPASVESAQVRTLVHPHFDELEEEEITRAARDNDQQLPTSHPISQAARAPVPLQLRELWRTVATFGGMRLFYVVAEKRYEGAQRDHDCDAVSLFQGWILEQEDRHTLHGPELLLSTCTEMQDRIGYPFIVLSVDDRYFAVVEWSLYEGTARDVLEITSTGVRSVLSPQF